MIYVISSKTAYAAKRLLRETRIMNYESSFAKASKDKAGIMKYAMGIIDIKSLIKRSFLLKAVRGDVLYIRNPYLNGRPGYIPQIIKLAKRFKAQGGRVVDANIVKGDLGKGKWVDYQKLKELACRFLKQKC